MFDLSSLTLRVKEASRMYYEVQCVCKHGEHRAVIRNVTKGGIISHAHTSG